MKESNTITTELELCSECIKKQTCSEPCIDWYTLEALFNKTIKELHHK